MNKKLIVAVILAVIASYTGLRPSTDSNGHREKTTASATTQDNIAALTQERKVVSYLQQHQKLPDYYMKKSEAQRQGWVAAKGNLCQVLPGKAIGGDRFGNREGILPNKAGRSWYEADVNYNCGRRGSDRLLWSNDGLIYLSHDHYQHAKQVN